MTLDTAMEALLQQSNGTIYIKWMQASTSYYAIS